MPDVFTEDTEDEHVVVDDETEDDEINWVPDVFIKVNKDKEVERDIVNPIPKSAAPFQNLKNQLGSKI